MKMIVSGRVHKPPRLIYTSDGVPTAVFYVLSSEDYEDSAAEVSLPLWVLVSVWGELAEDCSRYLATGMRVWLIGDIRKDHCDNGPILHTDLDGMYAEIWVSANEVRIMEPFFEGPNVLPAWRMQP